MCIKFRVKGTGEIHGFEHARSIVAVLKCGLILSSRHAGKESTLDLPESHHTAWLVFFFSRRRSFGEQSAAAAGTVLKITPRLRLRLVASGSCTGDCQEEIVCILKL